jgi:hypothetical protein
MLALNSPISAVANSNMEITLILRADPGGFIKVGVSG